MIDWLFCAVAADFGSEVTVCRSFGGKSHDSMKSKVGSFESDLIRLGLDDDDSDIEIIDMPVANKKPRVLQEILKELQEDPNS